MSIFCFESSPFFPSLSLNSPHPHQARLRVTVLPLALAVLGFITQCVTDHLRTDVTEQPFLWGMYKNREPVIDERKGWFKQFHEFLGMFS